MYNLLFVTVERFLLDWCSNPPPDGSVSSQGTNCSAKKTSMSVSMWILSIRPKRFSISAARRLTSSLIISQR